MMANAPDRALRRQLSERGFDKSCGTLMSIAKTTCCLDPVKRQKAGREHELARMERDRVALGIKEQRKLIESTLAWLDVVVLTYAPLERTKDRDAT